VIVHWAEDTFGRGQPAEYIPSDSTLGRGYLWVRSTSRVYTQPRPKVSSAQCTITGYILCWLTSPKGILCPVYYHLVYTLLVDLAQRYLNQQSIYPVIVHWAEDIFGRGQPAEYISGDSTLGRGYLWARSTSRVYTQ
jgi:hypothetical protein